jgi:hypothetical protein
VTDTQTLLLPVFRAIEFPAKCCQLATEGTLATGKASQHAASALQACCHTRPRAPCLPTSWLAAPRLFLGRSVNWPPVAAARSSASSRPLRALPSVRAAWAASCAVRHCRGGCKVEKERTGRQGVGLTYAYMYCFCVGRSQHGSMELVQEGAYEGVAGAPPGSSLSSLVRGAALQGMLHFGKEEGTKRNECQHDVVGHCARRVRTGRSPHLNGPSISRFPVTSGDAGRGPLM